jgi:hypothetical protein
MGRPVQVAAIGFARSGVCFDHVDGQYRDIEDVDIWEPAFATWLRAAEAGLDFTPPLTIPAGRPLSLALSP